MNPNVSVNVYGLEKDFQPPRKYPTYRVYPPMIEKEEKHEHVNILYIENGKKPH